MCPHNISSYIDKVALSGLPKYDMNKDETKEHDKLDGENPMRSQASLW